MFARSLPLFLSSCALLLLAAATVSSGAEAALQQETLLGAWRLDDGRVLTIAPSAGKTWRFRSGF